MSDVRFVVAASAARAAGWLSRATRCGSGRAITGKVLLALVPGALERLTRGRRVVLVSGTNGKSTTARLIAEAWREQGPVTTNEDGANLSGGIVSALLASPHDRAVLEVDELSLGAVLRDVDPEVVVLLNLARDQLDRVGEVSRHVRQWQRALRSKPVGRLVVNADDPLLVAAVSEAASPVTWVSVGLPWQDDARTCQRCSRTVTFAHRDWWCEGCGLRRPEPHATLVGGVLHSSRGRSLALDLQLPGACNLANAALAAETAQALGVPLHAAAARLSRVTDVRGRYACGSIRGHDVRLLLAKNPASARHVLDLLAQDSAPVVLSFNAEVADGRDPSWLWDVPFESLRQRRVVVTGRRSADLSVRLHYEQVPHEVAPDLDTALARVGPWACHVVGNYTAFAAASARLRGAA